MNKKKIIEKVVISSVVAICAGVAMGQVISSKVAYDKYRSSLEEAEKNRVGNPELDSISVKLKDGISYFKNGKASPKKDDFEVQANFTVKNGEDYSSNLTSKQFNMEVNKDFANNGGEIKFTYLMKETTINVSLKDVIPTSLTVTKNPNIINYEEGKTFDPTGMVVEVLYNDGSTLSIDASKLVVDTTTPLKVSDKSWNISYKFNGITLNGKVNISVLKKGEFSDGKLIGLSISSGKAIAFADEPRANSNLDDLVVMGQFDSGNYVQLNKDQYDIADKEVIVDFGKKANLSICAKDNAQVFCEVETEVVKRNKGENAVINGGNVLSATTYDFVNNEYVASNVINYVGNLSVGSTLKFNFQSKSYIRASLKLRVASNYLLLDGTNYHTEELQLNKLLNVNVNGASKIISKDKIIERVGNSSDKNKPSQVYYDVVLNDVFIKGGNNTITLSIKDSGLRNYDDTMASINIDYLDVIMLEDKSISLGEYNQITTSNNLTKVINANKYYETDKSLAVLTNKDIQGGCSDGKYGYFATSGFGGSGTRIVKFDFTTNEVIKSSGEVDIGYVKGSWLTDSNNYNKLFFENGKIGIFTLDNKVSYYDSTTLELLEKGVTLGSNSIDASYNEFIEEYVVVDKSRNVKFYDKDKNTIIDKGVTLGFNKNGYTFRSISSDEDYIYAVYRDNNESVTTALIEVYDWNGVKAKDDLVIDCSNGLTESDNRTVQNMVFANGNTYLVGRAYSGSNRGMFASKLTMSLNEFSTFDTSLLGGYVQNAMKEGKDPAFTNQVVSNSIAISKEYNGKNVNLFSVEGGCSDGKYLYYALTSNGRQYVTIVKYDLDKNEVIASSDILQLFEGKSWMEDCNLLYQNGLIYLINNENDTMKAFDSNTLTLRNDISAIKFGDESSNYSKITSVGYNESTKNYVFSIGGKMYITDENKNVTNTISLKVEHTKDFFKDFALAPDSGAAFQTLYADNGYIYALFNHNAWLASEIQIFDWSGNKIKTVTIEVDTNDDLNKANGSYNIQNLVELNGKLYLSVLSYGGKQGLYLYEISYK